MKKILITGVLGQTGSYLAELLAKNEWQIHGTVTKPSEIKRSFIPAILHPADLSVSGNLFRLLKTIRPDAIVNLAAISSVAESWKKPVQTFRVNASAVNEIFEYSFSLSPKEKINFKAIQASSSEIFEETQGILTEESSLGSRNPYGTSKLAAHLIGQNARTLGIQWTNAILFNHESTRRPDQFLSKKVAKGVAEISLGLRKTITLGDLSPRRDWGWAPDVAQALWLLLESNESDDYIISTGVSYSVEEYVSQTFKNAGISDWMKYVVQSSEFIRPVETRNTLGSPKKFSDKTGWVPSITFNDITNELLTHEINKLKNQQMKSHEIQT
jgi:GDPmannose 4,6-dehydratase